MDHKNPSLCTLQNLFKNNFYSLSGRLNYIKFEATKCTFNEFYSFYIKSTIDSMIVRKRYNDISIIFISIQYQSYYLFGFVHRFKSPPIRLTTACYSIRLSTTSYANVQLRATDFYEKQLRCAVD